MKKIFLIITLICGVLITTCAQENVKFAYDAKADFTTAWLWRGLYNGGMSFQPTADIGWDSEHTNFRIGAWANIGADDGTFDNSYDFSKVNGELDFIASLNLWGVTIGAINYYYCGKFNDGNLNFWNNSQTEVSLGYDFQTLCNVPLTITWNTLIHDALAPSGLDKKAYYSSYVDITYSHDFEKGWNLIGTLGFTPWTSQYIGYEGNFAINNIAITGSKTWNIQEKCNITLFAQGMMNTYYMPDTGINGCVGCSVRF